MKQRGVDLLTICGRNDRKGNALTVVPGSDCIRHTSAVEISSLYKSEKRIVKSMSFALRIANVAEK